jgi:glycosyltransferase 2 family protein
MPGWLSQFVSGHHIERGWHGLVVLLVVASLLEIAACAGLAYVAGFAHMRTVLADFHWQWLLVPPAAWVVSYVGYYFAYRGIFRVQAGPEIPRPTLAAVALAGFGGFLAYGGGSLDGYALRTAGAEESDAKIRVAGLAGLEQGALAILGSGVSIAALLGHPRGVPAGASIPWAVAPIPGFLIAFWLADWYSDRFASQGGWRAHIGTLLSSVLVIRELFAHPLRWGSAIVGMGVFWAADAAAAWAGLASFGFHMNVAALVIGFASGMLFTRRTGPLAGAGILALVLPLTISYCGAPFATAVAGVLVYRLASIWLPAPASLAVLPTLRRIGDRAHSGHSQQVPA